MITSQENSKEVKSVVSKVVRGHLFLATVKKRVCLYIAGAVNGEGPMHNAIRDPDNRDMLVYNITDSAFEFLPKLQEVTLVDQIEPLKWRLHNKILEE